MAKFIARTDCGSTVEYGNTLAEVAIRLENSGVIVDSLSIVDTSAKPESEEMKAIREAFDADMRDKAAEGDAYAIEYFENR